jgi:hypothetical protein
MVLGSEKHLEHRQGGDTADNEGGEGDGEQ